MQFNILQQDYSLMLSEETHTCRHTLKCTKTHTQKAWLLNTRGLTRYSSAICGKYCCIPGTQYAQHIILLISLTLSPSVFLLCLLSLSSTSPHLCSLVYFFLFTIIPFLGTDSLLPLSPSFITYLVLPSSSSSTLTRCLLAATY